MCFDAILFPMWSDMFLPLTLREGNSSVLPKKKFSFQSFVYQDNLQWLLFPKLFFDLVGTFAVLEDQNVLLLLLSLNIYHLLILIFNYYSLESL